MKSNYETVYDPLNHHLPSKARTLIAEFDYNHRKNKNITMDEIFVKNIYPYKVYFKVNSKNIVFKKIEEWKEWGQ